MPRGGRVALAAARVDEGLEIVIEDSGVGIEPELLDKIFDLYVTTKSKGSGIGLSMVYRIVQLHGGEITVEPEVQSKLEQAGSLLSSVGGRELSQGQREQGAAARGFVAHAQRALDEGDERRALVLIDKGLILAEDVERTSRP